MEMASKGSPYQNHATTSGLCDPCTLPSDRNPRCVMAAASMVVGKVIPGVTVAEVATVRDTAEVRQSGMGVCVCVRARARMHGPRLARITPRRSEV